MDDPELLLTERVAEPGSVIATEDVYELTAEAVAYLGRAATGDGTGRDPSPRKVGA